MFDRLNSAEMLCLMRELEVPQTSGAQCVTVSSGHAAWIGGGSSSKKLGFITAVDLDTSTVISQVQTAKLMHKI